MIKRNYVGFRLEAPLYDKIKMEADLHDEPISAVIRNIIAEHCDNLIKKEEPTNE